MALPVVAAGVGVLFGGHVGVGVNLAPWCKTDNLTFIHVSVLTYLAPEPKEPNGIGPVAWV